MKREILFWSAALYGLIGFVIFEIGNLNYIHLIFTPSIATAYFISIPLGLIQKYYPDIFLLSKVASGVFHILFSLSNSLLWVSPFYFKRIYFFFLRTLNGICGNDTCHLYLQNVPKKVSIDFSKKVLDVKTMTHNDVLSAFIGLVYGIIPPFMGYTVCSDGYIALFFGPSYTPSLFLVGLTQIFSPIHLVGTETVLLLIFNGLVWAYAFYTFNRFMSKQNLKKKYILLIPWGLAYIIFFELTKLWLCSV